MHVLLVIRAESATEVRGVAAAGTRPPCAAMLLFVETGSASPRSLKRRWEETKNQRLRSIWEPNKMSKVKDIRAKWGKFIEAQEVDKEIEDALSKFMAEEVLDKMVEDGILRVDGIDEEGRKVSAPTDAGRVYAATAAGRSPHLIVPPERGG
jgi:hypothetical protein